MTIIFLVKGVVLLCFSIHPSPLVSKIVINLDSLYIDAEKVMVQNENGKFCSQPISPHRRCHLKQEAEYGKTSTTHICKIKCETNHEWMNLQQLPSGWYKP
jgi:hypothetical protein